MSAPVRFVAQLHVEVVVGEDGTVMVVVPAEAGDVLDFVHGVSVAGGEYRNVRGGGSYDDEVPVADEDAVEAAWATAEAAVAGGRCPVVVDCAP